MIGLPSLIVIVVAAWLFGSGLARFTGAVLVLVGVIRIASDHASPRMWAFVGVGIALWLFGHWLWAVKHKLWRSQLALSVFSLPVLRYLAPIPTNNIPRTSRLGSWSGSGPAWAQHPPIPSPEEWRAQHQRR